MTAARSLLDTASRLRAEDCACVRPGAPVCAECPCVECSDCGLPMEHCECDAPCDLCGDEHERDEPCYEDDFCECGTWPCTCDQYGYDDFSDDWDGESEWRGELRFQSKRGLCTVCSLYHDERICDLWRSGDVRSVRGLLESPPTCPDCHAEEQDCVCDGEPIDPFAEARELWLEVARDRHDYEARPWEVLRAQLEALGFKQ